MGWGSVFKCFARDHRIAQCRDPPRCLLCSKSGHKARFCLAASGAGSVEWRPAVKASAARSSSVMELIPGDSEHRPAWVTVCVARTGAIREAEWDVQLHSLIGV